MKFVPSSHRINKTVFCVLTLIISFVTNGSVVTQCVAADDKSVVRVFIFAGQSNMVGSDSKVADIKRFPPYVGLENAQSDVRFSYCIGRENKIKSDGWVDLQAVNNIVGPELSFARDVNRHSDGPIAIIKVAAGGTHLGGDWNPDDPIGFKMYPLALQWVRDALADFEKQGIEYRLEGFMWHQGENDMFNQDYMPSYGKNLKNFLACWRRDLKTLDLRFYIGELCTKTIWGMDLRPRMYAISLGQKEVAANDPLAQYVATSHVGVEIGGGVGLHYHYGTLGQLQHGTNYATAYLDNVGKLPVSERQLETWPYAPKSKVKLFVLAGHRNMEGERAFVQELAEMKSDAAVLKDDPTIAFKYSLGDYKTSRGWEPLGPADYYDTFGPELSFARTLRDAKTDNIAIAKFTHSGSQIIDWTPEGSVAKSRNLYTKFIGFVKEAVEELQAKGHEVELSGIFYHVGENDMSWGPFRKGAPERVMSLITQSHQDLQLPDLMVRKPTWYVSQQPPTDDKNVNEIDVAAAMKTALAADQNIVHLQAFDLPKQEKQLVIDTKGIVWLGNELAKSYLQNQGTKGRPTVVCFGDSITNRGYPGILSELLNVDAINAGVGGNTTAKALRRMKTDVLDRSPDVVVVFFGTNDLRVDAEKVYIPVPKYKENLRKIIDACRKGKSRVVLCTLPPIDSEPFFTRHKREIFDRAGGLANLIRSYQTAAIEVASEAKVPLVDLQELLRDDPQWLSKDGVHPSAKGTEIIAKHIANAVKLLVER